MLSKDDRIAILILKLCAVDDTIAELKRQIKELKKQIKEDNECSS